MRISPGFRIYPRYWASCEKNFYFLGFSDNLAPFSTESICKAFWISNVTSLKETKHLWSILHSFFIDIWIENVQSALKFRERIHHLGVIFQKELVPTWHVKVVFRRFFAAKSVCQYSELQYSVVNTVLSPRESTHVTILEIGKISRKVIALRLRYSTQWLRTSSDFDTKTMGEAHSVCEEWRLLSW